MFSESVRHVVSLVPWNKESVLYQAVLDMIGTWSVRQNVILSITQNAPSVKMTSLHTPRDFSQHYSLLVSRVFPNQVLILIFSRNLVMFRKYLHKRMVRLRVLTITSQLAWPYLIQHLLDLISVDKMGQLWISRQYVTLLFKCKVYLTNALQHWPCFVICKPGWTHTERSGKKSRKTGSKVINRVAVDQFFKQIGQKN